ncbi:CO/xanthine dehydrogenase Mo-binding subunit [Bradyrhizobium sp. JR6.1]
MSTTDIMSSVRPDLIEKVTGRAEYVTDLMIPGVLHGFVVRSPASHARIASLDRYARCPVSGRRH